MQDLYAVLGVPRNADKATVRKAYRKRAQESHPDKKGGSTKEFQMVKMARDVLSDDDRRATYDRTGETSEQREPTLHDMAVHSLAELMIELVNEIPPLSVGCIDLIAEARKKIDKAKKQMDKALIDLPKQEKKFITAAKRLRRKTKGDNALSIMMERQAAATQEGVAKVKRTLAMIEELYKILDEYECEQPSAEAMKEFQDAQTNAAMKEQLQHLVFSLGGGKR